MTVADMYRTSSPFFGWLHLIDIHSLPGRGRKRSMRRQVESRGNSSPTRPASTSPHPRYDLMYDVILEYVNEYIECVVNTIRENDVWDETVLIVTGDHGELLGGH